MNFMCQWKIVRVRKALACPRSVRSAILRLICGLQLEFNGFVDFIALNAAFSSLKLIPEYFVPR